MLLIYCPKVTNRAGYVFNLIFKTILGTDFEITSDEDFFANHEGTKVCYNGSKIIDDCIFIKSKQLLFEHSIDNLELGFFETDGIPAFFGHNDEDADLPFDIFAASFYLVSRYEEYLPFRTDKLGCYDASNSLAYNKGFLDKPVIDIWAWRLAEKINQRFPQWEMPKKRFDFISTVNLGQAYKYKRIGLLRTAYGYCHDIAKRDWQHVRQRTRVLFNKQDDPYDNYEHIIQLSRKYGTKTLFWSLMCDYTPYDHNISYRNEHLRNTLKHLADYGKVGISLSYNSSCDLQKQEAETERLAEVLHKPVIRSRFNYQRFHLPLDYKNLNKIGIEKDFSMGYHNAVGFRAGTCTPFHFFSIKANREYNLLVYPTPIPENIFAIYSPDEALDKFKQTINEIAKAGGTFVNIWKSEYFTNETYNGIYEQILELCKTQIDNNHLIHKQL